MTSKFLRCPLLIYKSSHESEVFTNVYFRSQSKKKAFTKSCTKWADDLGKKEIEKDLAQVRMTVL